jgi:hypothetical protein
MKNNLPVYLSNKALKAGVLSFRTGVANLIFPLVLALSFQAGQAQILPPGLAGKFGVDADMISNARTQGTFTGAGSHDWFKFGTGTGIGIFDTIGASVKKALISQGSNHSFAKPMQYSRYSIQDGTIQMDALYVRDYFGLSTHVNNYDRTVYTAGNGVANRTNQDPSTWTTEVGAVPNKVDLIDVYLNMSRQGNSLNSANPSPLFLYVGATTLGTNGERYLDFELFRDGVTFNSSTGTFSNTGPASTGGRNIWTFNPDGSLNQFGDLTISFSFNSSTVTEIAIYIWLPYSTYLTTIPSGFDIVPGSWTGLNLTGGFGYAKVSPKAGTTFQAWGAVNTASLAGPAWGTNSADAGVVTNQYYSPNYMPGQFAEGAINLTSIGLDPLFSSTPNCEPPFERIMAKSRSSAAFNSALQDFIAPTAFLGVPVVPADIAPPGNLTCAAPTRTLSPSSTLSGASYNWTTSNGHIVSGANTANPVIDAPGTYTLSAAILAGCTTTTGSVVISRDTARPVASATYLGQLTTNPNDSVTLKGGDTTASKQNSSFGGSSGFQYTWAGPGGFTSSQLDAKTNVEGTYLFTITETRNGCRSMANVTIAPSNAENTLPVHVNYFNVTRNSQQKPELKWDITATEGMEYFIVQRSSNGIQFTDVARVNYVQGSDPAYYFTDHSAGGNALFYRIKAFSTKDAPVVTNVVKTEAVQRGSKLSGYFDAHADLNINYTAVARSLIIIEVYTSSGQAVAWQESTVEKGSNLVKLKNIIKTKGVYFVRVNNGNHVAQTKVSL